jgi:hypothetical protein
MTHSRSPSLHAILEELPDEDDLASSEGGELWFPSPEGVQHDDTHYSPHPYTIDGGDPDVPDHTDEATVDHYIDNPT